MITSESIGQELEQSKLALQEQLDMDKLKYEKAKEKFEDLNGLLAEIEKEIYPTIVSIKTINGVRGTGFIQHPSWLVTNAHIFPCMEVIEDAEFINHQLITLGMQIEQSYHRPERDDAPDIVLIKTTSLSPCLPFSGFSSDSIHEKGYLFYIDFDP